MLKLICVLPSLLLLGACASSSKLNAAGLQKWPHCYSTNVKLSNACIAKNEAGENVTALELENTQYAGQYK